MHHEGPFFLGSDISLPDLVLAPWAVRLWVFDEFKQGGLGMPSEGEVGQEKKGEEEEERLWRRWRKWLRAVERRQSVLDTTSEKEHYLPIYKRYALNEAQSELAKAIRAGKGVP